MRTSTMAADTTYGWAAGPSKMFHKPSPTSTRERSRRRVEPHMLRPDAEREQAAGEAVKYRPFNHFHEQRGLQLTRTREGRGDQVVLHHDLDPLDYTRRKLASFLYRFECPVYHGTTPQRLA